jgi:hypothetical protein
MKKERSKFMRWNLNSHQLRQINQQAKGDGVFCERSSVKYAWIKKNQAAILLQPRLTKAKYF